MKKLVLAVSMLAASTVGAFAADMAARPYTKAPAVMVAVYDWSGFYIGGNVGGGWNHNSTDRESLGVTVNYAADRSDVVGGGQIGYNFQFASNWVFGIEAGYTAARFNSSNTQLQNGVDRITSFETRDVWDVVGRLGYANANWLFYARGGYAETRLDILTIRASDLLLQNFSNNRVGGYVVGGGIEYGITRNWIVGVEYNYYNFDLGNRLATSVNGFADATYNNNKSDLQTVTGRLSYKFGGPVVAKY